MGNTVGNAVSSKQEETTGSMKHLSHLSCFMWLMGTIHSSIHPFFPSVNKDVWVPSICQTLVQVLKMQQWTKQVRSLPDGACSVTMKVSFSAASPFVWETTACAPAALRLIAPPSRTGPQEALRPPIPSRAGAAAAGSVISAALYPAASLLLEARSWGTCRYFSFLKSARKGVQGNWEAWWIEALWKWITAQHGERGDGLKG